MGMSEGGKLFFVPDDAVIRRANTRRLVEDKIQDAEIRARQLRAKGKPVRLYLLTLIFKVKKTNSPSGVHLRYEESDHPPTILQSRPKAPSTRSVRRNM